MNDLADQPIVEAVRATTGLIALVQSWTPLDESLPEIADEPAMPECIFPDEP